jgi:hypothetical protein
MAAAVADAPELSEAEMRKIMSKPIMKVSSPRTMA